MEVLKDKHYISYDKLCRYSNFPVYYNTLNDKYCSGTTTYLSEDTEYVLYEVRYNDTYDSISLAHYGNPTYYWVICNFNRISDAFEKPKVGSLIKVPVISNIEFYI